MDAAIQTATLFLWVAIFLVTTRMIHHRIADPRRRSELLGQFIGSELIFMAISVCYTDPEGRAQMKLIFGPNPMGIPYWVFGPVLISLIFSPLIAVLPHTGRVTMYDPRGPHPTNCPFSPAELQRSYKMFLFGVIYVFVIAALWIHFSDWAGI